MEKGPKIIGGTAALLVSLGTAYYFYSKNQNKEELIRHHFACDFLENRKNALPSAFVNRKKILSGYETILRCKEEVKNLSLEEFHAKYTSLCISINKDFESKSPKWRHPILHDFLKDLRDVLCKPENQASLEGKPELKTLKDLRDNLKTLNILKPETPAKNVCDSGMRILRENEADLRKTISYLIKNQNKLYNGSSLKKLLLYMEKVAAEKKMTADNYAQSRIGRGAMVARNNGGIALFDVCTYTAVKDMIKTHITSSESALIDLIELLNKDNSAESQEIAKILLKISPKLY